MTEKIYTFTASNTITADDVTYHFADSVIVTGVRIDYEMNVRKFYYAANTDINHAMLAEINYGVKVL